MTASTAPPRRVPAAAVLLAALSALTLWRWAIAWFSDLELDADEAQYWSWSLSPDWGYYSKPPMVAWLIRLGTTLFGDAEIGVRAATFVVWPVTAWIVFLLVRRLYRGEAWAENVGLWAALAFATLPGVSVGSRLITTDGPLLLFWALSLYLLVRALDSGSWRDWLVTGLAVGLGMMSKYSMALFAPSLVLFLLATPRHRPLLLSPRLYASAAVALALLSPNLLWNAQHGFATLRHTAEISQLERSLIHPDAFLEFFLAQFAVFGPLLAGGLLVMALRPRVLLGDDRLRFLAAFTLVPLGTFLLLSLLSRAFPNWAAFSYVAGAALVAVSWARQGRIRLLVAALAVNLLLGAVAYHYHDIARAVGAQLTRKTDPYYRIAGHRELGKEVAKLLAQHPTARLLGNDRKTFSRLLYYTRPRSYGAAYLNPGRRIANHYALVADIERKPEGEFILITRNANAADLRRWFAAAEQLDSIHIPVLTDYSLDFQAWLVRDFRGY